ncbi:MAG: ferritin-like domain-containing protein [Dehalobacter sp. 4CP]|uniref:ferritin-like domain-containing protein n=1 Tax=Dehalobacter sp. CP TaxID=2594474 RepID=UPI0013C8CE17|nr:ferritin-like domain-containing protein [Dehalobacter sp. 4CP]
MNDKELIKELNKILTLEHGHLGMYKDFLDFPEKEIRRTFRRFMEIEIEHIGKLENVIRNLGAKPSLLIETGDIFGKMLDITLNLTSTKNVLVTYSKIEIMSHQGYAKFVVKLEQDNNNREQFLSEFLAGNMLEAKLMHLWLEDQLKKY